MPEDQPTATPSTAQRELHDDIKVHQQKRRSINMFDDQAMGKNNVTLSKTSSTSSENVQENEMVCMNIWDACVHVCAYNFT